MKRNMVLILIGVVILAIAAVLYVYFECGDQFPHRSWFSRGHHPHLKGEAFLKMMRKDLNLTDEQYENLIEIHRRNEEKILAYKSQFVKFLDKLDAVVLQDTYDERKIRRILEDLDRIKREERILHIKSRFEMQKFLTPAQKDKMDRIMKEKFLRIRKKFKPYGISPEHGKPIGPPKRTKSPR
jgi:Spy/CpxP family protein refolding chaperone